MPEEKIKTRYLRAMKLFPQLLEICDECYVYDNSADRNDVDENLIVKVCNGKTELLPNKIWSIDMLKKLCSGIYEGEE